MQLQKFIPSLNEYLNETKKNKLESTIEYLKTKKNILFLTTSNRWDSEKPKSTMIADIMVKELNNNVKILDVSKLIIYNCEGNVSSKNGNNCGVKNALLNNNKKNPSGHHRCWASLNNTDDELWKVSKEILNADIVIFFGSIRWGKMNAIYSKLIERLTWLENRHTSLGESNIIENIEVGIISVGHNWNSDEAIKLEMEVLTFFGFKVIKKLCWSYQYTKDYNDESLKSYSNDAKTFKNIFNYLKESLIKYFI